VTESRRLALRLSVLAAIVLAVHLWLLGGLPRVVTPAKTGTFVARNVEPPAPPAPPVVKPAPVPKPRAKAAPAEPAREEHVSPPPVAPRSRAITSAPKAAPASAPQIAQTPSAAPATSAPRASEPASATREAGAAAASHIAVAVAPSARYHYDVTAQGKGLVLRGNAVLDWRNRNGEYEAQLSMSSPFPFVRPRTQRSVGTVTAQGLAPVRFSDKSRSEEAAHFDRENGRVIFSTNKPEAVLEPGVQDRLSIVIQLGAMLAGEPSKYKPGSAITVQTASTKEAEPWTFTVEETAALDLPGGRVQAVRLLRNPRKQYDVKVELWLAPGAAYAPVRLRLTQPNGDWVDQQWSSTDRG
jgi:hypothetical protein